MNRVLRVSRRENKAGQTMWMEAGSRATENIGTSSGHNLVVELKK
jgi:hypothetical protein